ncbi:MAG: response regulator [Deltaproteobacteria bacterium]|nr:MAG: response regulator [Deltaproteobacteria bacterium]
MVAVSDRGPEGRSVLIVEDDFDVRDALSQLLEFEGYMVAGAANGQEAIDHLRSTPRPAAILLDLMMPVMDGFQFRSELMHDPTLASIPVIIISADASVAEKAARMGATAYLRKPIEVDALLHTLERFCLP